MKWNKLDLKIVDQNLFLVWWWTSCNSAALLLAVYMTVHNLKGIKLLIRSSLHLSHFMSTKFSHDNADTLNMPYDLWGYWSNVPLCSPLFNVLSWETDLWKCYWGNWYDHTRDEYYWNFPHGESLLVAFTKTHILNFTTKIYFFNPYCCSQILIGFLFSFFIILFPFSYMK